ncbi:MAG: SDR family oxidoreductase [Gammaproteobacteria bacterium]|nr:SDR family oxidoreductase [Gammaproteobacteria bacterium]
MDLSSAGIVLTGASGGIGGPLAEQLAARGGRLLLVGRNRHALEVLEQRLPGHHSFVEVDLTAPGAPDRVALAARERLGAVDVLLNLAGGTRFCRFEQASPDTIRDLLEVNLLAPMLLTRAVLPEMVERGGGRILNVGSIFGSIGFAYFAGYSTSKFGLRGFSEALRRELSGTGVGVTYVAPRAVRTPLNAGAIERMGAAVGMKMDDPVWVAGQIVRALEQDRKEQFLGWPERFFVRLNGLFPGLVDRGTAARNRTARTFTEEPEGAKEKRRESES